MSTRTVTNEHVRKLNNIDKEPFDIKTVKETGHGIPKETRYSSCTIQFQNDVSCLHVSD